MTQTHTSNANSDDFGVHGHRVGTGVITILCVLIVIGVLSVVLTFTGNQANQSNTASSNRAAGANQHYSSCTAAQGIRWREASSSLQIGLADLVKAGRDKAKVGVAAQEIVAASAQLTAVNHDDQRLTGTIGPPLCPYVAGNPTATPAAPVDPTHP